MDLGGQASDFRVELLFLTFMLRFECCDLGLQGRVLREGAGHRLERGSFPFGDQIGMHPVLSRNLS